MFFVGIGVGAARNVEVMVEVKSEVEIVAVVFTKIEDVEVKIELVVAFDGLLVIMWAFSVVSVTSFGIVKLMSVINSAIGVVVISEFVDVPNEITQQ